MSNGKAIATGLVAVVLGLCLVSGTSDTGMELLKLDPKYYEHGANLVTTAGYASIIGGIVGSIYNLIKN